jgi:hypothetical protein
LEVKKALSKQQINQMRQEEEGNLSSRMSGGRETTFGRGGGGRDFDSVGFSSGLDSYRGSVWETGAGVMSGYSGMMGSSGSADSRRSGQDRSSTGRGERPTKRRKLEAVDPESEIMRKLYVGNMPTDAKVRKFQCRQLKKFWKKSFFIFSCIPYVFDTFCPVETFLSIFQQFDRVGFCT